MNGLVLAWIAEDMGKVPYTAIKHTIETAQRTMPQRPVYKLPELNIDISNILTDQLIDMRADARANKNFALSDQIRSELDKRGSFCMDGKDGQVVYHLGPGYTRESVIKNIRDIDSKFI